jgi:hypothetical protein
MRSLAVRVTLAALFMLACGVAAYLLWINESRAGRDSEAFRTFESAAIAAARDVLELRAAEQAYVAAGQGEAFWIEKAGALTASLGDALPALRSTAASPDAQSFVDTAASALQDFQQIDRRARDYARSGQKLLASDLISRSTAPALPLETASTVAPERVLALDLPEPAPVPAVPLPSVDFNTVARLCADFARVADTRALPAILDRAAGVLDARGIVIWIADPDGRELSPIVTHGYPPVMVTRLGTIPTAAENATASAFRTSLMQTVKADAVSNGAIAAPLVTPAGCVGVMAAEMRHEGERDSAKLAAAAIVAAQLATLVGPPSSRAQARTEAV